MNYTYSHKCASSIFVTVAVIVTAIVLLCLYTNPNHPEFSIEGFFVPSLNKTLEHRTSDDIYFDLKLRNMNKAIGLYYEDPSSLAFSYDPLQEPFQKYTWVYNFPAFYQGNGKTKHIKSLAKNEDDRPRLSSTVVFDNQEENIKEVVETKYVARSLLEKTHKDFVVVMKPVPVKVVNFRINLIVNYRFKLWGDSTTHQLAVGADVAVDAASGESVTEGSINLVKSGSAPGGPILLVVLFASFLVMSI